MTKIHLKKSEKYTRPLIQWLIYFLTPIFLGCSIITGVYFWMLYPESSIIESLYLGPPALHFIFLEVFVSAVVCHLGIFLLKKYLKIQKIMIFLSFVLMIFILSINFIQFCSLYLGSDYLTVSTLTASSQIGLVATPQLFLIMMVTVAFPFFLLAFHWTKFVKFTAYMTYRDGIKQFFCFLLATIFIMQSYHLRWMRDLKWEYPAMRKPPARAFFDTLSEYWRNDGPAKSWTDNIHEITSDDIKTMANFGIDIDVNSLFPLIKNSLFSYSFSIKDLPQLVQASHQIQNAPKPIMLEPIFKELAEESHEKYNVITIFAESLSARLLGTYGASFPQLTPNIDRFSSQSLTVKGYVNHAFPTIPALTGTLCSIFPQFSHTDWNRAKAKLGLPPLNCLPKFLEKSGYDTYFLGYSHPRETFFRDQMIDFGFSKTFFYDELSEKLLNESPEHGALGNSDYQMFASLKETLSRMSDPKPFFMAMSTIETHVGMDVSRRGKKYFSGDHPTLNTVHNFDHQFGLFMTWLKSSRFANNTIVILTADHAHPPSMDFAQLMNTQDHLDYQKIPFDFIPLIIHFPDNVSALTLDVPSSSLDFAPTVANILSINNQPHHFLGRSIFDLKRENFPRAGIVDGGRLLIYEDKKIQTYDIAPEKCFQQKSAETPCSLARGIYFIFDQMAKGKIWTTDPNFFATKLQADRTSLQRSKTKQNVH